MFQKISEEELVIADRLKNTLRLTREELADNFDKKDPEFVKLKAELERLFKEKKLNEVSQDEMISNIDSLRKIYDRVKELNRINKLLRDKYNNDEKYARIHKRLMERGNILKSEYRLFETLCGIKTKADETVLNNIRLLKNEDYFHQLMMNLVIDKFEDGNKVSLDADSSKYINNLVVKEYMDEYNGVNV